MSAPRVNSAGKLVVARGDADSLPPPAAVAFGIVRSLLKHIVNRPPMMESVANAVCGTNCPKTMVAPTNGAVSSQMRAQTIVEKAHIFFFSADTSSVVQVVRIANVDEMATLETIALHISRATRASVFTGDVQVQ